MPKRRGALIAGLLVVGCGPERPVAVQDWMLRAYSSVAAGIRQDVPSLRRLQFRDDFTMEYVAASQTDETTWIYEWEPTSPDSVHITPREDADLGVLGVADASPYSGQHFGEELDGGLQLEKLDGPVIIWYPGAMCVDARDDPECTTDDAWCWEAYPCEEERKARASYSVSGYVATLCRGEVIAQDGVLTDARPGRLVRAGRLEA